MCPHGPPARLSPLKTYIQGCVDHAQHQRACLPSPPPAMPPAAAPRPSNGGHHMWAPKRGRDSMPPPVSSHSSHTPGGGLGMHNASVRALFSPHRRLCAAWSPNPHKRPYRDLGLQVREKHPEEHLARRPPQHQHGPRRCKSGLAPSRRVGSPLWGPKHRQEARKT
jgi:hypothetical protein